MRPTTLLRAQHQKVIAALKRLERARNARRPEQLEALSNQLCAHLLIEQELFYPAARQIADAAILQAYEEHSLGELALKRLRATEPTSETFRARAVALRGVLERHFDDEERELFPAVERRLDGKALQSLGARMRVRYDEAVEQGFEANVPQAMTQTSADVARSGLELPEGLERYLGDTAVH